VELKPEYVYLGVEIDLEGAGDYTLL